MKILVINTGSSSIKYQLFDMAYEKVLASGLAERIGEDQGVLIHKITNGEGAVQKKVLKGAIADHGEGLKQITNILIHPDYGVIQDQSEISAIGHRVVHGGETFQHPSMIDEAVIQGIKQMTPLAPLHNPPNLAGIETAKGIFPDVPHVAVFDTAFHQNIPKQAFLYALPYDLYKTSGVRRYGFHGTSHAYVSETAAEWMGHPVKALNLITIHLGNGASMAAVQNGMCVDTSMGMTPLEGLVMGTRSGDVDPALPFFLVNHLKMTLNEIDQLLNKESGLKGLCGTNDMREVLERRDAGDEKAKTAVDVYAYRIKKYIGAYYAVLGSVDAIIFTGGIGENSPVIRKLSCEGLTRLGIEIDDNRNHASQKGLQEISPVGKDIKVLVVPTNEELKIARETRQVLEKSRDNSPCF